jgi:hypothetical protein
MSHVFRKSAWLLACSADSWRCAGLSSVKPNADLDESANDAEDSGPMDAGKRPSIPIAKPAEAGLI